MTTKHFVAIAKILANTEMPAETRRALAREFADLAHEENPRFSYERFFAAVNQPTISRNQVAEAARVSCEEYFTGGNS